MSEAYNQTNSSEKNTSNRQPLAAYHTIDLVTPSMPKQIESKTAPSAQNARADKVRSPDVMSISPSPGYHQVPQVAVSLSLHPETSVPCTSSMPTGLPNAHLPSKDVMKEKEAKKAPRKSEITPKPKRDQLKKTSTMPSVPTTSNMMSGVQRKHSRMLGQRNSVNSSKEYYKLPKQAQAPLESPEKEPNKQISSHLKQFFKESKFSSSPDKVDSSIYKDQQPLSRKRQKSAEATQLHRQSSENEYQFQKPIAIYGQGVNLDRITNLKIQAQKTLQAPISTKSDNLGLTRPKPAQSQAIPSSDISAKRGSLQKSKEGNSSQSRIFGIEESKPSKNQMQSQSPNRRLTHQNSGSITKLHEKVIWFYRRLCDEYESPINNQFINETIPAAFKTMKDRQGLEQTLKRQSSFEGFEDAVQMKKQSSYARLTHSGVVRLYLPMFTEKNVQAICDTLRRFQSKIKVIELYLNNSSPMTGGTIKTMSTQSLTNQDRMSSPMRPANMHLNKSFPRVTIFFQLLKSLTVASTISIISDTDNAVFLQESQYAAFISSLGRQKDSEKDENYLINSPKSTKKKSAPLSEIEIQGCQLKPSFFKLIAKSMEQGYSNYVTYLSLVSCGIQDTEGGILLKAVIHGRQTPNLKCVNLKKNLLGFKFGSMLIALLIDAQSMAQEETMNSVSQSNGKVNKLDSLDHFSLKKIDLEYNKLSYLVIQTVDKLLKNMCNFREQAKIHQNFIQTAQAAGQRGQQQGSTANSNFNYEMQPHKVIIEETQETDSESSSHCSADSFDGKDLTKLFEDFIVKNKRNKTSPIPPLFRGQRSRDNSIDYRSRSRTKELIDRMKAQGTPFKQRSHRNYHEQQRVNRLGSLRSEKNVKTRQTLTHESSSDVTDKEDISGKGSNHDNPLKPNKIESAPARTMEPNPSNEPASPKSKNLELVFQNLKQQILDGNASSVAQSIDQSPLLAPAQKPKRKSESPTPDRVQLEESPIMNEHVPLFGDRFVSSYDLASKVNRSIHPIQVARKNTEEITDTPILSTITTVQGSLPPSRTKSPINYSFIKQDNQKKQMKARQKRPRGDKLEKTNSEIRNFMDPRQVAARTNFMLRQKADSEKESQQSEVASSHPSQQQSVTHPTKKNAMKSTFAKSKKKKKGFRTITNSKTWSMPDTGPQSLRGSIHKKDKLEQFATNPQVNSETKADKMSLGEPMAETAKFMAPRQVGTERKVKKNLFGVMVMSPPLIESKLNEANPSSTQGSFVMKPESDAGTREREPVINAKKEKTLKRHKSPRTLKALPQSNSASLRDKDKVQAPVRSHLVTIKEMSRAEINVIKDIPKMSGLSMNRSSSAEGLNSPPLDLEQQRGRNSTNLSSAKTERVAQPMQRPPKQQIKGKKNSLTNNEVLIHHVPHRTWDTATYSTLGKPPLSKQNLKKSVESANADFPIDLEESSSNIRKEESKLAERSPASKSLFEGRRDSFDERQLAGQHLLSIMKSGNNPPKLAERPDNPLKLHMQSSSHLREKRLTGQHQNFVSQSLRIAPRPTPAPLSDMTLTRLGDSMDIYYDMPSQPLPDIHDSVPNQEPPMDRPNKSANMNMIQQASVNQPRNFLAFHSQAHSWMENTYRSSEMSESKPTHFIQTSAIDVENFVRSTDHLDYAQQQAVSHDNFLRRSMPSLPDGRGTDEDEPIATKYCSQPTVSELDPSMLAEEFGRERSDVGQKLQQYHVSPTYCKRKNTNDSVKNRHGHEE